MADTSQPITLTERAARRIADLVEQEGAPNGMLRVAVSGGGCSGFQYGFSLDHEVQEGDVVIERDQAQVVIDNLSLMYLAGSEVDYVTEIIGSYFTIKNPNATSSCGCGSSFAVS
ncbi:MAG: iron-sulfur cluster insertion protein ErpA [Proteobacteria bacterium]|nr:iron-sulfur cluster insertion protein ErpA [Pseudomonadota bacterium]